MVKNSDVNVSDHIEKTYQAIMEYKAVKEGLDFIKEDHEDIVEEQKRICSISAPTFKEQIRGQYFYKRFKELGLEDVSIDEVGNVFGIRKGTGKGPKLLVAAHLDTVFDEGTDTNVKEKDGKLYAPGISDDTRGLVEIISIIKALNKTNIQTIGDIVFCANVCEEGLGDLRGVKHIFKKNNDIDGFISIDGTGVEHITYIATGSRRYKITYKGPGGHSLENFGLPSAIHALGRAISEIADIKTPSKPKTTFTVGKIEGGTSINSIAAEASMYVDMRSNCPEELSKLENKILNIAEDAAIKENERWNCEEKISVDIELIGDRPAGSQNANEPIVQAAACAVKTMGFEPCFSETASTDANLPISLGIPAITVGTGGKSDNVHTVREWFDPKDAYIGVQKTFLLILGLVGIEDIGGLLI